MEPGNDYSGYYTSTRRIVPVKYAETGLAFESANFLSLHHPNPIPNAPRNFFGAFRIAPQVYREEDGIVATTPSPALKFPGFSGIGAPFARHTKPGRIPREKQYPVMFQA